MILPYVGSYVSNQPLASWDVFDPISPLHLTKIIATFKTSSCPQNVKHPQFFKLVVDSVGPGLVSLLNKCLLTGLVPMCLKVATVTLSTQEAFFRYI